jgi:hypothetical protein
VKKEEESRLKRTVSPYDKRSGRARSSSARFCTALAVVLGALLTGCAGSHNISVERRDLVLGEESFFYINLNHEHERVVYDFTASPLNYNKYGGGRKREKIKPDVPEEIAKSLIKKNKKVEIGGGKAYPGGDTVIVTYDELWGWDMGDIIKRLRISAFKKNAPEKSATVDFSEMTFFNSHPTAKKLVPKMIDSLFAAGSRP